MILVAVLDRIDEGFVEGNEEIRPFRFDQTEFGNAFEQVLQHAVHQREIAWQLKLNLFVQMRNECLLVDVTKFIREGLLDYLAKLVTVVRECRTHVVSGAHFESLDDVGLKTLCRKRHEEMFSLELTDRVAVGGSFFGKVADDEVKLFEIRTGQRSLAVSRGNHNVAQFAEDACE